MPVKDPERRKQLGREAALRWRHKNLEKARASYRRFKAKWKATDPEGLKRIQWEYQLKRKGLTVEEYEAMLAMQAGRCAICNALFADSGKGVPHIDHNHECCPANKACKKCLRGLLCHHCNMGLGRFRDNPTLLRAAAFYVLNPPPLPFPR